MNLFNNNIKFMHFRQLNKDGTVNARGGLTLAYYEEQPGLFTYAAARCSKDDNYSRHAGRCVAVNRLRLGNQAVCKTVEEFRQTAEKQIAEQYGLVRSFAKKRKHPKASYTHCKAA